MNSKVPVLLLAVLFVVASFSFASMNLDSGNGQTVDRLKNKLEEKRDLVSELREKLGNERILRNRVHRLDENLKAALQEYEELQENYGELVEDYKNLKERYKNLREKHEGLQENYGELVEDRKNLREKQKALSENRLVAIPYAELKTFLKRNRIDENEYVAGDHLFGENTYDCAQFSNDLYMAAIRKGYRVAIVNLVFEGNVAGHGLNAFEVTGDDIVFVEPQNDTIYYEPLKPGDELNGETVKKTVIRWPDNAVVYG